jgi:hypothetical protein
MDKALGELTLDVLDIPPTSDNVVLSWILRNRYTLSGQHAFVHNCIAGKKEHVCRKQMRT